MVAIEVTMDISTGIVIMIALSYIYHRIYANTDGLTIVCGFAAF